MKLLVALAIFAAPLYTFADSQSCPSNYKKVTTCEYASEESNLFAPEYIVVCKRLGGEAAKVIIGDHNDEVEPSVLDGVAAYSFEKVLKAQFATENVNYFLTKQVDGSAEVTIAVYGKVKPSAQYSCN